MEYLLPYGKFYPRKGLFLYHFQKNEKNPDLKSRNQKKFRRTTHGGRHFFRKTFNLLVPLT